MNKLSTTLLQSGATLAVGAAIIAAPMFAFAHTNADTSNQGDGSARTVTISDNGSVLVRGAKVTAVDNGDITAKTAWNSFAITWTVDTDSNTDLVRLNGANANGSDVKVGDYISFSGALNTDQNGYVVKADTIRDWSLVDPKENSSNGDNDNHVSVGFWQNLTTHMPVFHFFGNAKVNK